MALTHLFADLIILSNIVYYFVLGVLQLEIEGGVHEGVEAFNKDFFMIAFGMVIYSFEGIPLVLPIKKSMKDSNQFEKVLIAMMITITAIFCMFGGLYYLTYGDALKQIVTHHY